jgi:hypothetical protein
LLNPWVELLLLLLLLVVLLEQIPGAAQSEEHHQKGQYRCQAGHQLDVQCLRLGRARILHLPGELFVEYQLAAKDMRSDLFVAVAAYGDYAPWYIGTEVAYRQGSYETGPDASNVAPEVEAVLMATIRKLLSSAAP